MSIVVIGAGRKAEHLVDLFGLWDRVECFFDHPLTMGETKREKPVKDTLEKNDDLKYVVSAVGDCRKKRELIQLFEAEAERVEFKYAWGMAEHPTSIITYSSAGVDFIIRELSSVGSSCKLGDHVSIGPLANLSHHSSVGDYSTICGQAAIGGSVVIGDGVFIGQGAVVKPDVKIGKGALIGAGAVVVKDVSPNAVVAGNPAHGSPRFKGLTSW